MSDFIKNNTRSIIVSQWKTLVLVTLLLSFLMMLINIFASLVYGIHKASEDVRSKLGVYLYIKEDPNKVDEIYNKLKDLSQEVKKADMQIQYYSKADALEKLQKKIPDVVKNFQRYGIQNPLPPTLYVTFPQEKDLETLKKILLSYRDIISNNADLEQTSINFRDQEKRVQSFINMSQAGTIGLIVATVLLLCIISTFLTFMIKSLFDSQLQYIQVTKLLGASFYQVKVPFYLSQILILFCASLVMIIVGYFMIWYANDRIYDVYKISLLDIIHQHKVTIASLLVIEIGVLMSFNTLFSRFYLDHLLSKEA